jgi:hypothetical protein
MRAMRLLIAWIVVTAQAGIAAEHPSFEGRWKIDQPVTMLETTAGRMPPLRAGALALYRQRMEVSKAGDAASYDATYLCKPKGDPRTSYEEPLMEIVQAEDVIFFGYGWNRMARFAYVQAERPDIAGPSYYGTWTARWQGRTLELSGEGFNASTLLDAAGMPHSEKLHVVQRLALSHDGKRLTIRTTFDDPEVFAASWATVYRYLKTDAELPEDICPQRLHLTIY